MNVDLLIVGAAQLVTCASGGRAKRGAQMRDLSIIADGAVAVKAGRILDLGTTADMRARYQSAQVVNASGRVVCPGLVDCHTHAVYAGDRSVRHGRGERRRRAAVGIGLAVRLP